MKKFIQILIIIFCSFVLTSNSVFAKWIEIDNDYYVNSETVHTRGNYLYITVKTTNINNINTFGLKESIFIYNPKVVNYIITNLTVDIKNIRIKSGVIKLYDKNDKMVDKYRKGKIWDYDIYDKEYKFYSMLYKFAKENRL